MRTTSIAITLEQLVAETSWLHRLASSLVQDQATAEDLVHDTVLVAAEHPPLDDRPLRPWLVRVLRNRARMRGRSAARRRRRELAVAELAVAPATPGAIIDRIELLRLLEELVLELALPLRDVVLLHFYEGLSSTAIGNRLGIANGTVRWRLKQAITELRDRLEQHAPNGAWIPPLSGPGGAAHRTGVTGTPILTSIAIATLLALFAAIMPMWQATLRAQTSMSRTPHRKPATASMRWLVHALPGADAMTPGPGNVPIALDQRRFTGVVVDRARRPIGDAELGISCGYENELATGPRIVHTASDGTFGFEVDPDCSLSVVARKGDEESPADEDLLARYDPKKPREPLVLQLAPTPAAIFRIVDADTGAPIAGARLSDDYFRGRRASAASDGDGIGWIRLGNYAHPNHSSEITIDAPGYPSVHKAIASSNDTDLDGPIEQTVQLVRGVPVSGRVVDRDGRGVASSFVVVEGSDGMETCVTDAAGAFAVAVARASRYRVQASPPGLMMRRAAVYATEVEVGASGRTDVVVQIAPEARRKLTGTVIDSTGHPIAGALVRAAKRELYPVVTDTYGRFSFHIGPLVPLPDSEDSSRRIPLVARHGSLASAFITVDVRREQDIDVTLQLGPANIMGIVVDLAGIPVPGAEVRLNSCGGVPSFLDSKRVKADAEGWFVFEVPHGNCALSVRRSSNDEFDERDDKTVPGGLRNVHLVIP